VLLSPGNPQETARPHALFANFLGKPKCFQRLIRFSELIGDAPLGEVWYSGVLGGVPLPA